ncbi:hypothetical protein N7462_001084 [Penicillium macrosclerotiorum]|uniref:uncharacterized protein n=1 Tax=Penicillium macrosclerotiorum TaxID=303699 RepID=UPI0025473ECA|nr:uncharacterized protein N7462_001084 [Penicillium macrosclerotiorum]KAJ5699079.1 hypothetical protein N7462_001084 [Penicillium macrosclerotiorum]
MSAMASLPSIPAVFHARKSKIVEELALPDANYTDLSPKGSVDEGVRDLIRDINALPGLVTTSSCAGRISVFLEGHKKTSAPSSDVEPRQFAATGGKGAGRWLYVSHDPFDRSEANAAASDKPLHRRFGLVPGNGKPPVLSATRSLRMVRFHYDPLILHIMAATLNHAQPVLAAASASGFRESGLQGLRCLDSDTSPIVAVRSAGLSFESVIGYCDDNDDDQSTEAPTIHSLVTEEYLELLIAMSDERFAINIERKERFRTMLLASCSAEQHQGSTRGKQSGWEDPVARRERKRAEGLMRKKLLESSKGLENVQQDDIMNAEIDTDLR